MAKDGKQLVGNKSFSKAFSSQNLKDRSNSGVPSA